jgi:hypothetical protein
MSPVTNRNLLRLAAVLAGGGSYVVVYHLHEHGGVRFWAMASLAVTLSFVFLRLVIRDARGPQP